MRIKKELIITVLFLGFINCYSTNQNNSNSRLKIINGGENIKYTLLGGENNIPVDSIEAQLAYDFLKTYLAKNQPGITLQLIQNASKQIVAGSNITLICQYLDEEGKNKLLYAKIYISLQNEMTLSDLQLNYKNILK